VCYRVRDTLTKWCCDQDWDEGRWGFTRQKKRSPAQASTALHVAFCLLRLVLAFFSFSGELPICWSGYRIIVLRFRWLITPVIRGKTSSLITRLCASATGIAEILFEQPVRLLRDYRGFHYRGSRNYFLGITRQRPSTGHYQRRADCGHNQQNHGMNNRILQRLIWPTWRLTRRSK